MTDYRITLPTYTGPMDLLLFLIRRSEVDIYDIPVSGILEQYLAYLEVIKTLDIDAAGDFMVMASRLMEIKSRMLLPREKLEEDEGELIDPRAELVRELLEYKEFRDRARKLHRLGEDMDRSFPREAAPEERSGQPSEGEYLDEVTVWDLVTAFSRISREVLADIPLRIVSTDTPLGVHVDRIMEYMEDRPDEAVPFSGLFRQARDRIEVVGLFLALLELVRRRRVRASQPERAGEIYLSLREPGEEPDPIEPEPEPVPQQKEPPWKAAEAERPVETKDTPAPEPAEKEESGQSSFIKGIDERMLERLKKDADRLAAFDKALEDLEQDNGGD